jgi:hypothetical protein
MKIDVALKTILTRSKKITLKLMWDHMPITGRVYNGEGGNRTFTLPAKYKTT